MFGSSKCWVLLFRKNTITTGSTRIKRYEGYIRNAYYVKLGQYDFVLTYTSSMSRKKWLRHAISSPYIEPGGFEISKNNFDSLKTSQFIYCSNYIYYTIVFITFIRNRNGLLKKKIGMVFEWLNLCILCNTDTILCIGKE